MTGSSSSAPPRRAEPRHGQHRPSVRRWAAIALLLATALPPPVLAGDAGRGEAVFQRCYACHSTDPAETGLTGPNLSGIVGRPAAVLPRFDYSPALQAEGRAGLVWTPANLDRFLADPQGFIPGNAMGFFGLRDPEARADLIAYLAATPAPR